MPSGKASETRLESLSFWPREAVRKLAANWIDTAGQVVAMASTKSGLEALATQAGLPPAAFQALVEQTRDTFSASERDRLSRAIDTSEMGLGARKPVKPK